MSFAAYSMEVGIIEYPEIRPLPGVDSPLASDANRACSAHECEMARESRWPFLFVKIWTAGSLGK